MKIFFCVMLLSLCSIGASAQVTFNMRVGGGLLSSRADNFNINSSDWNNYNIYKTIYDGGISYQMQCNIPLNKISSWTFSPSICLGMACLDEPCFHFYVPLEMGKKVSMGYGKIFFPKLGFATGFYRCFDECDDLPGNNICIIGPSASLDFEIYHFVIGMNAYYSPLIYRLGYSTLLTLGYKF